MKFGKQIVSLVLAVVVIGGGYLLYSKVLSGKKSKPQQTQVKEVPADIYIAKKDVTIPYKLEYPGKLLTYRSINVIARVTGLIMKRYHEDGDYVTKDALLFDIEPDMYAARVKQAEAEVANQKALLIKAESDYRRVKSLYEEKIASQYEYDSALAQYESSKAMLKNAEAQLELAKIDLGYTKVKAPVTGILSLRAVEEGTYVQNNTYLVTIHQIDPVYADFSIPDNDDKMFNLVSLANAKKITPIILTKDNKTLKGTIEFVDSIIDNKTATIKVRTIFTNKSGYLMPGDFVRIAIDGVTVRNGVKIPTKALIQGPNGTNVYVLRNGVAASVEVRVVAEAGDYSIIGQGLQDKDQVILNNFFKIKPGVPVKINKVYGQESR